MERNKIMTYTHPIKGIPLAPKSCHTEQKTRVIWLSPNYFRVEAIHNTFKVPYCDYFHTKFRWDVRQNVTLADE